MVIDVTSISSSLVLIRIEPLWWSLRCENWSRENCSTVSQSSHRGLSIYGTPAMAGFPIKDNDSFWDRLGVLVHSVWHVTCIEIYEQSYKCRFLDRHRCMCIRYGCLWSRPPLQGRSGSSWWYQQSAADQPAFATVHLSHSSDGWKIVVDERSWWSLAWMITRPIMMEIAFMMIKSIINKGYNDDQWCLTKYQQWIVDYMISNRLS